MKKKSTIDKLYLINKKILKLLDEEIALIKSEPSLEFSALSKNLTKKLKKEKTENIDPSLIKSILFETLTSTVEYNNEKIVYLGPKGSYTQEAAINKFGTQNLYYSVNSIKNIFFEVNEGRATYGIVPIENSSNGIVGDTINCFYTYNLNIVGETVLDIHHTLVSNCKNVEDIKTIYSKDIAFDQCSIFLENYHLNEVKYEYVESTTKAAKLAAQNKNSAAICSKLASITNNIPVLFNNIEDNKNNRTRFLIISKKQTQKTKKDKTSIIARLSNSYGSLINFLEDFKKEKISLNKIKSHIVNGRSTFFIEFEGHKEDKNIENLLSKHDKEIKCLGSYPKEVEDI